MNWTCALFGHEKPRYYIQDAITGLNIHQFVEHPGDLPNGMKLHTCTGVEKRAEPGDVIALKPEKCWHCDANQHHEIVSMIKNPAYLQTKKKEIRAAYLEGQNPDNWRPAARFERIWKDRYLKFGLDHPKLLPTEIKSYFSFLPGASLWHVNGSDVWGSAERRLFLVVGLENLEADQLLGITEQYWDISTYPEYKPMDKEVFAKEIKDSKKVDSAYDEYIREEKQNCSMPTDIVKKRRFNIHSDDLRSAGVDIDRMLDPNILYVPDVSLSRLDCLDKLKTRKVVESDQLQTIQPRVVK